MRMLSLPPLTELFTAGSAALAVEVVHDLFFFKLGFPSVKL